MKKFLLTSSIFVLLLTPLFMSAMPSAGHIAEGAAVCVDDCFEETALAKGRANDLQDFDIVPVPPLPVFILLGAGFVLFSLHASLRISLRTDRLSLHCSYLE